jgi:hypothetical protein
LGGRKEKEILDDGVASNDEHYWQEVSEKYQQTNEVYDSLAWNE